MSLKTEANAWLPVFATTTRHTLLRCLAQVRMNAFETRTVLNVAMQHIKDICTGQQQGDANKHLTSMRLNRRALWKVLLRSSPMTSGSYLSILVRNTRVGISAQHHAETSSHASIDTVHKSGCICTEQHSMRRLARRMCDGCSCVSCLRVSNGSLQAIRRLHACQDE